MKSNRSSTSNSGVRAGLLAFCLLALSPALFAADAEPHWPGPTAAVPGDATNAGPQWPGVTAVPAGGAPAPAATEAERTALEKAGRKVDHSMTVKPPVFEPWPLPPTNGPVPAPAPMFVVAPEMIAPKAVEEQRLYSFRAENLDLKTALAIFARANHLNIVPDPEVTGVVTLDLSDLPLKTMLKAMLEALDFSWTEEGGLIRVHGTQTRRFTVDYLRMIRNGVGRSSATLSSGTSGTGGGGGGSGGGGSGGGGGGSGGGGGGSSGGGGGGSSGGGGGSSSDIRLELQNPVDYWKDLKENLDMLLTPAGKATLAINRTAGIVQVTDRPSALKRVEEFLKDVGVNSLRQVDIEARLFDVTLNNDFQFGIDWIQLAAAYGGTLGAGALTAPQAIGGATLPTSAIGGLSSVGLSPTSILSTPAVGVSTNLTGLPGLVFANKNTQVAVNALKQQGSVEVIAQPRIRALNNQTALVKVGTETPFFAETFQSLQSVSGNSTFSGDTVTTITVGTILSLTPQISADGWIAMDVSPVLTSLTGTETSPDGLTTAPVLDTKQASSMVRMRDGTTVVLGGLIQTQKSKNETKVPVLGDVPLLGKLFTGKYDSKVKKELVIFLTPTIVR